MIRCPSCGIENYDVVTYCASCQTRLSAPPETAVASTAEPGPAVAPPPDAKAPEEKPRKRAATGKTAAGGAGLVALILSGLHLLHFALKATSGSNGRPPEPAPYVEAPAPPIYSPGAPHSTDPSEFDSERASEWAGKLVVWMGELQSVEEGPSGARIVAHVRRTLKLREGEVLSWR